MKKIGKSIDGHFRQAIKRGYYVRLWIPYPAGMYSDKGFYTVARIIKINGDENPYVKEFYEDSTSWVFTSKGWGTHAKLVARRKSQLSVNDLSSYNDGRSATDWRRVALRDGGTSHWEKTWEHNFLL